jgi:predicted MFS family arabinose efflux permease
MLRMMGMAFFAQVSLAQRTHLLPVWALCVTQIISWGTLYYAFPVLLAPIGTSRGWNQADMVGAFSFSLLISGACAYPVGKLFQRLDGRAVMSTGSALAAVALALVAAARSVEFFYLGWAVAGMAMALTLYEAAFTVLALLYESDYRRAVTIVTLAGGFASTLFWPLTERLVVWIGWYQCLLIYAGLHVFVCLPLHAFALSSEAWPGPARTRPVGSVSLADLLKQPRFLFLATSYTLNAVVFAVVSVHLIPLLQARGASSQEAAWLAAAAGPMQVAGRLIEFRFGGRWRAGQTGAAAMIITIPALVGLMIPGTSWPLILVSVGLYGISNGVMTIVRSLSIVELFERRNYAQISGAIAAPATVSRALGPYLASLVLVRSAGYGTVLLLLGVVAILALTFFAAANRGVKPQRAAA